MDQEYSDPARGPGAGIARGAALIAGLTVLSRLMGLVRTLVFSQSIGADCLGTAYATANQVPNLIYELVLGGALTSAMVPVLARSAARAAYDPEERARISQITSALLTWSVLILAPLTLATAAAAGPIAALLNPVNANTDCLRADMVSDTRNMIEVFSPQVILYGLSVVLFGLLQAYRRFTAPALAPLISSLVLIASYLTFAALDRGLPLAQTPLTAELILAAGTTLGVAALVLAALPAMRRLHLTYRPALRFPAGVGRRAGGLAFVGVIELVTIDVSNVVVIALANGRGDTGALVIFNYPSLVFNAIYAVLALSVVTSAFPVLSARERDCLRPGLRRIDPSGPAPGMARNGSGRCHRRPSRARPRQAPRSGARADRGVRPVRSGHGGGRGDREPVAGHVRHRAAEDGRRGAGRQLAAGHSGRSDPGRAGAAPACGCRARPG